MVAMSQVWTGGGFVMSYDFGRLSPTAAHKFPQNLQALSKF